jgi:hypothetical protein
MKTGLWIGLFSAALAFTATACSSSHTETVGDQCGRVMDAFCSRASACGVSVGSDCASSGTNACCQSHCGDSAISNGSDVDTCTKAMNDVSCASLSANVSAGTASLALPGSCTGVVKHASAPLHIKTDSVGAHFSSADSTSSALGGATAE